MATLNVTGMQEAMRELVRLGDGVASVADAMLAAGGQAVTKGWQDSATSHGHIRTGAMLGSIKPTRPKIVKDVRTIFVYPQGADSTGRKKPVRNAEKAVVLHYGRRNMTGSKWVKDAEEAAEGPALSAMEAVFDSFIASGDGAQPSGTPGSGAIGTATFFQR